MKATIPSVFGGLALGAAGLASAEVAGICTALTYADGFLYCRKDSSGTCSGNLGDFPATKSFPLYMSLTNENGLISEISLLEQTAIHQYNRYQDVLYIDTTPGSFSPVGFADPSTITGAKKSSYWFTPAGLLLWSPTTKPEDGSPTTKPGIVSGSGFQLAEVPGYPGLMQQYWNQTLFDQMRAGAQQGGYFGAGVCYGDYSPVFTELNHP